MKSRSRAEELAETYLDKWDEGPDELPSVQVEKAFLAGFRAAIEEAERLGRGYIIDEEGNQNPVVELHLLRALVEPKQSESESKF